MGTSFGREVRWLVAGGLLAAPAAVLAQDAAAADQARAQAVVTQAAREAVKVPATDAVRETWQYFFRGQGQGPVLAEAKLCSRVGVEGAQRNECLEELAAASAKAGSTVMVWQAYLVPQGDNYEDVMVQLKQGDLVRETRDVKVKGEGIRYRIATYVRLPGKPGAYTITILRGGQELRRFDVVATK